VPVAHRERLDMDAVAGQEPALEVGAPHVVRRPAGRQRRALRRHPPAPRARPRQPGPVEHRPDRARRRPRRLRLTVLEPRLDLARPPARETMAHRHHRLDHLRGQIPRIGQRRPRPIHQTGRTVGPIPRQPLVARLPADPEVPAQLRHALLASKARCHETRPLIHDAGLSPGHGRILPDHLQDLSPMSPV